MSRGQLFLDDTIVRVFLDRLEKPDARIGAILDGFPADPDFRLWPSTRSWRRRAGKWIGRS